jgi:hypothetical protein
MVLEEGDEFTYILNKPRLYVIATLHWVMAIEIS